VGKIIEVDATITSDLAPFIETANLLVTKICTSASYTDEDLELIERWLSAHFYAVRDPRPSSERAGAVGANYQHAVALNLAVTTYGQQAMLVAYMGELSALNRRATQGKVRVTPGVSWVGVDDWDTNNI